MISAPPFKKVLIAGRGEIALRILRACRELGIQTVAVHSMADKDAKHVRLADESVCIGPAPAKESYLNIAAIVAAAEITGADAVHPGVGFLSENAHFAEVVTAHNMAFIGPSAEHIALMGHKTNAKEAMQRLGVPVVPGSEGVLTESALEDVAGQVGYPVLLKAVSGGGGRGIKVVHTAKELAAAWAAVRQEATACFGDAAVYLEKYLEKPRHIEVQVLGDAFGQVIHLGERECSVQRRNQKVWEEGPSPILTQAQRDEIGRICAKAMADLGYQGLGTLEFLFEDGAFYFMEMNTRLQVEHTVTEMITGVDLVQEQIRVAAGLPLSYAQEDIVIRGHAIECRVNAEHPETFAPSPGRVGDYHVPGGPSVRVDSALYSGYTIPPYYDSLIAKLVVHGADRATAIARLQRALDEYVIGGVETTLPLHRRLAVHPDMHTAAYDIHWLEETFLI